MILLEYLRPYDKLAAAVERLIPKSTKAIVYLEEEIRNGGAGMLLSEKVSLDIPFAVIGTDNDFVCQKKDRTMYESAGVSKEAVIKAINQLLNK